MKCPRCGLDHDIPEGDQYAWWAECFRALRQEVARLNNEVVMLVERKKR